MSAQPEDPDEVDDIARIHVRSTRARWCRSAPSPGDYTVGPMSICSATTTCARPRSAATRRRAWPRASALAAMEEVAAATLPPGFDYEVDRHGAAGEGGERADGGDPRAAVLFAYLFLVALYESWTIPVPVLLSVTSAWRGRCWRLLVTGDSVQHLCPDRAGRADRAGGEERDPDRGIRQGAARGGAVDRRRRASRARMRGSGR
jgi:hypothetical protein